MALSLEDNGATVTLKPGETKVISCHDNYLTLSDDTGCTLSIYSLSC